MPHERFRMQESQHESSQHPSLEWAVHQVEEQPMSVMALAFGVGFVVGVSAIAAYCAADSQARHREADRLLSRVSDRFGEMLAKANPGKLLESFRG